MFAIPAFARPSAPAPGRTDATMWDGSRSRRIVVRGNGFTVLECTRRQEAGPPCPCSGQGIAARVLIVTSGLFRHGASPPRALLTPGAMLFGETLCECDLEPIDGDIGTLLAFEYSDSYLEAVRDSMRSICPPLLSSRHRLDRLDAGPAIAYLPASKHSVSVYARAARMARDARVIDADNDANARDTALAVFDTASRTAATTRVQERIAPDLEARIAGALRHVERHHSDDCSLDALAAEARLGVFHFLRSFKRCVGQTPCQYVMAVRLREAADLLASSDARVLDIAIQSGFGDLSHFNASFREAFGVQPSAYRKTYRSERIAA